MLSENMLQEMKMSHGAPWAGSEDFWHLLPTRAETQLGKIHDSQVTSYTLMYYEKKQFLSTYKKKLSNCHKTNMIS
jgi:hypothetical protein